MPQIDVNLPGRAYAITVESGLLARLGEAIDGVAGVGHSARFVRSRRVMLAVDAAIADSHGETTVKSLAGRDIDVHRHQLIADEQRKTIEAVRDLCHAMLLARCDRESCVIAIGGGIVGDIAGFAAASFMRGVPVIHVPTTLLAMVDASIGGKTGVNLPLPDGTLAKNMIGAFWQPRAIFADPTTLLTLDDRHFRCGLAECIKHAMIERSAMEAEHSGSAHPETTLLDFLIENAAAIASRDLAALTELIARSARIKAAIVEADEHETAGVRALLNLGHTFGHAFESLPHLNLLHGEAVAIGLNAAMRCAVATGQMDSARAQRIRELIETFGLPLHLPLSATQDQIQAAMQHDKKASGDKVRLVLPRGTGHAQVIDDVAQTIVERALRDIGVTS